MSMWEQREPLNSTYQSQSRRRAYGLIRAKSSTASCFPPNTRRLRSDQWPASTASSNVRMPLHESQQKVHTSSNYRRAARNSRETPA